MCSQEYKNVCVGYLMLLLLCLDISHTWVTGIGAIILINYVFWLKRINKLN